LNQQHGDEAHNEAEADDQGEGQYLRPSNFDNPSHRRRKQVPRQMPRLTGQEQEKTGDCG
jgi:hypothetical protein